MNRFSLLKIILISGFCFTLIACAKEPIDDSESSILTEETISDSGEKDVSSEIAADIDITSFSGTMAYAEVSNMQASPDNYIGKLIRMDGQFATYEEEGVTYPLCIVEDATACCSIGMEFVPEDEYTYPEIFTDITIIGEFQTYERNGELYCNLINTRIE